MNFKTTAVLLLLVVVGLMFWLFSGEKPAKPAAPDAEESFGGTKTKYVVEPQLKAEDMVRIVMEGQDRPRMVFERSEQKDAQTQQYDWTMLEPIRTACESWSVSGIASTLAFLTSSGSYKPGEMKPADAGLEPPQAVVVLTDKDRKEHRFEIGRRVAMSSDTYVRVGETIHVVNRDLLKEIKKNVGDYRTKNPLRFFMQDVTRAAVTHEGRTIELTQGADKSWLLTSPVRAYAEDAKVTQFLSKAANVRVTDYVADSPASLESYGLSEPFLSLTIETQSLPPTPPGSQPASGPAEPIRRTFTLLVGGMADLQNQSRFVMLAGESWVAKAPVTAIEGLAPQLSELRDARVTRLKAANATELELASPGGEAVLKRAGATWQGSGDLERVDGPALEDVLRALEDLRAVDFIDAPDPSADYGLAEPRATLRVATSDAVQPLVVRVGGKTESGLNAYVQVEGQSTIHVITEKQAQRLAVTPLELRDRNITSLAPDQIQRIDVQSQGRHYLIERAAASWKVVEPAGAEPDTAALGDLARDLARLRAARFIGKGDDAEYGLDNPTLTVTFWRSVSPGSQPATQPEASQPTGDDAKYTLRLVRRPEGVVARLDDDPFVFEIESTVARVLTEELLNRQLWSLNPDEVVSLKIESTGGTVHFLRDGKNWAYGLDRTVKLDAKRVSEFVAELARPRVEMYLKYNDDDETAEGWAKAPATVTLELAGGSKHTLKLTPPRPGELPRAGIWLEQKRSFVLQQPLVEKLMRGLDAYLPSDPSTQPATPATPPIRLPAGEP